MELPASFQGPGFVLFTLCEFAGAEFSERDLRVHACEGDLHIVRNPKWPQYLLALPSDGALPVQDGKLHLTVELRSEGAPSGSAGGLVESNALSVFESIQALPAKGMFSVKWGAKARIAAAKKVGGKPEWAAEDFPWSHFDGAAYLRARPEVLEGVLERKWATGLEHFLSLPASTRGLPPISTDGNPNAGNLRDFLKDALQREISLRAQITKLKSRIENFRKENGENAAKRKLAEGKIAASMKRIESFRKENGENAAKRKLAEGKLDVVMKRIESFRKENGENAAKRKLSEGKLAVAMKRIESFRKENGENAAKRKLAEGKLAEALKHIEILQKVDAEDNAKQKIRDDKFVAMAAELDLVKNDLSSTKSLFAKWKETFSKEIDDITNISLDRENRLKDLTDHVAHQIAAQGQNAKHCQ